MHESYLINDMNIYMTDTLKYLCISIPKTKNSVSLEELKNFAMRIYGYDK
jgi:hypothetical protein